MIGNIVTITAALLTVLVLIFITEIAIERFIESLTSISTTIFLNNIAIGYFRSSLRNTKAGKKLFQNPTIEKRAKVARSGFDKGSMMMKSVLT